MRIHYPTSIFKAPQIVLYGLVFSLVALLSPLSPVHAAGIIYQQTGVTGSSFQLNSGNSIAPPPVITGVTSAAINFASSSPVYVQLEVNRSSDTFSNAAISSFGSNGPRLFFESNSGACFFQYAFTQADIDNMFAAWSIGTSNYAVLNFALPMSTYSATDCNFSAGATFKFGIQGVSQTSNSGGTGTFASGTNFPTNGSSAIGNIYLVISGTNIANTSTHIDTITPPDMASTTTATPVALGATGYLNPTDFAVSPTATFVQWAVIPNSLYASQCADVACAANQASYFFAPITASTTFNVASTTAVLPDGIYTLTTSIVQPAGSWYSGILAYFGIGSAYNTLYSQNSEFFVGTTTAFDQLVSNGTGYGALLASEATSTQALLSTCNLLSGAFDMGTCMAVLFFPSQSQLQDVLNNAETGLLARAPWGYVTRMVSILGSTSTTTASLPTWTATFPTGASTTASVAIDPGDMLAGGAAIMSGITDPNSGLNLRQIAEPWLQLFIALSALIIIFHDVMAMGVHKKGQHQ